VNFIIPEAAVSYYEGNTISLAGHSQNKLYLSGWELFKLT